LSDQERKIILDRFAKIEYELQHAIDKHSKQLIVSNIKLFLNYCERYYDRQFITRENANKGILEKFEDLLNGYFSSDKPHTTGLPSVAYCAEELSPVGQLLWRPDKKRNRKICAGVLRPK
jgi:hypothetical protein